jgi:P pilus assembly chaperone PapD
LSQEQAAFLATGFFAAAFLAGGFFAAAFFVAVFFAGALVAFAAASAATFAGSLEVAPLTMTLGQDARSGSYTFQNPSDDPIDVVISVERWRQDLDHQVLLDQAAAARL